MRFLLNFPLSRILQVAFQNPQVTHSQFAKISLPSWAEIEICPLRLSSRVKSVIAEAESKLSGRVRYRQRR